MLITTSRSAIIGATIKSHLKGHLYFAVAGLTYNTALFMLGNTPPAEIKGFGRRLFYRLPRKPEEALAIVTETANDLRGITLGITLSAIYCIGLGMINPKLLTSRLLLGNAWKTFNKVA